MLLQFLGLNFARNLYSVGWVLISSPLWLITSQRREMLLQFLLPIKTSGQNLRAWEVVFLHQRKERSCCERNKKSFYIPQNLYYAALSQSRPSATICGSLFLGVCILHLKQREVRDKIILNFSKFKRCNFFFQSRPSATI